LHRNSPSIKAKPFSLFIRQLVKPFFDFDHNENLPLHISNSEKLNLVPMSLGFVPEIIVEQQLVASAPSGVSTLPSRNNIADSKDSLGFVGSILRFAAHSSSRCPLLSKRGIAEALIM